MPESLYPRLYAYCEAGLPINSALQLIYLELVHDMTLRDKPPSALRAPASQTPGDMPTKQLLAPSAIGIPVQA